MKKFYQLTAKERINSLLKDEALSEPEAAFLLKNMTQSNLIENYITDFKYPVGVLKNITIDNKNYLVPMATEEPSVIAAANNGAKQLGNIETEIKEPIATMGQIFFKEIDADLLDKIIVEKKEIIFELAKEGYPSIVKRGGGLYDFRIRKIANKYISFDYFVDTCDAMGANMVNTIGEYLVRNFFLKYFKEENVIGVILSNSGEMQIVEAKAKIKLDSHVSDKMVQLSEIANNDPYRAVTNNKGIMNGIGAVVLATGNDWRAVDSCVHEFASKSGKYCSLTKWEKEADELIGKIKIALPVGTVGGTIGSMTQAKVALSMLGNPNSHELRKILAAVGLAQNFAAMKAIVDGGIQKGHMKMQYRSLVGELTKDTKEQSQLLQMLEAKLKNKEKIDRSIVKKLLLEMRQDDK